MDDISTIPIGPLAQLATKLVDYFQRKREQKDAIEDLDRGWVGERISRPLVDMHGALVKVDTVFDVYSGLLQTSSGNFHDILVRNHSKEFIRKAEQHLMEFWDNIDKLEKTNPGGSEVMESVKYNACASKDRYGNELKQQIDNFLSIGQSGSQPGSHDVKYVIDAFHNLTTCYVTGVAAAIEDLAHAGRKTSYG